MGGMTDTITQGARLGRWGRGRVGCGGLVFGCPLSSFSFLAYSFRSRRGVLQRSEGHYSGGRSKVNRLHWCHSYVWFGVVQRGLSRRSKIPYWNSQG